MKNGLLISVCLLTGAFGQAQMLDRIAVTVGKTVITEGEVLTNLRVAAFLDQKEPDLSAASRKQAASRLVDQTLLRREVPLIGVVQDTSVVIADLKKRYASQDEYEAALRRYQISEQDVTDQLLNGLESLEASNRRFLADVQVTDDEVRSRYEAFAQQLREKNTSVPAFDASRNQVQELLTGERVSDALEKWLETEREHSSIRYREAVFK